ncbi:MAG: type I-B CRISPR-associated protein Cas8b1/Cst1 [Cyclobacteriaceae bacterium]
MIKLFDWTGEPFTEAGLAFLLQWLNKEKPSDINLNDLDSIKKELVIIYSNGVWKKNLYTFLTSNSVFTHRAYDNNRKQEIRSHFEFLTIDLHELGDSNGCTLCGRRKPAAIPRKKKDFFYAGRENLPLSGSGSFLNFFPHFTGGMQICKGCLFLILLSPLNSVKIGGRMGIISTSNKKLLIEITKENYKELVKQLASNNFTGANSLDISNPTNNLFKLLENIIYHNEEYFIDENAHLRLLSFTNFGQSADQDIYDLPNNCFSLIKKIGFHKLWNEWWQIVFKGSTAKNKEIDEEKWYNNHNIVYSNLLEGKGILGFFYNKDERKMIASWQLIKLYLREYLNMDQQKIDMIKKLGNEISEAIKRRGTKRGLMELESVEKKEDFLNVLLKIQKDKIESDEPKVIFTLDDIAELFFTEQYNDWKTIRQLFLFRIYENLYEWLKEKSEENTETTT